MGGPRSAGGRDLPARPALGADRSARRPCRARRALRLAPARTRSRRRSCSGSGRRRPTRSRHEGSAAARSPWSLIELPLVLPPAVAGIGLLAAFGRTGLLPTSGRVHRRRPSCSPSRSSRRPFYVRTAIAAFEAVDPTLVGRSADARRPALAEVFRRRCAAARVDGGLGAGAVLAFARGLGEFGATIMFAGSLPGRDADAPARDLRRVRARLRRRAGARRAPRRFLRSPSSWRSSGFAPRSTQPFGFASFELRVELETGAETLRARQGRRAPGSRRLLRAVAGLVHRRTGVVVDGDDWGTGESSRPSGGRVGLVFQDYALFPHLTVRAERRVRAGRAGDLLERLRIEEPRRRAPARALGRRAAARGPRARARSAVRVSCSSTSPSPRSTPHTRDAGPRRAARRTLRELGLPTIGRHARLPRRSGAGRPLSPCSSAAGWRRSGRPSG